MLFFENLGQSVVDWFANTRERLAFLGEAVVCLVTAVFHPRQFRFGDFALAFQRATFDGLAITTGIGFLLGVILAFQSAAALRQFGVEVYIADLLAIALFRELGPIITAI